eukprot:gene19815-26500_t
MPVVISIRVYCSSPHRLQSKRKREKSPKSPSNRNYVGSHASSLSGERCSLALLPPIAPPAFKEHPQGINECGVKIAKVTDPESIHTADVAISHLNTTFPSTTTSTIISTTTSTATILTITTTPKTPLTHTGEDPLGLDGQAEMAEVADPAIMRAAAVAISHLNNGEFSDLNLMTPLELTTITTATKQAVNEGVLYMVSLRVSDFRAASVTIKCMVWSRPWLASSPNPEMADILYKAEISIQLPVRRISGGVAPLSTDNPSVLIAMEEALSMINQGAYSEIVDSLALQLPLTLVGVSSAQTQIV